MPATDDVEFYCRDLGCWETTYGAEAYCRVHLPWLLCRPSCKYCRGTAFAVYGTWADRDSLVCLDASLKRQHDEFVANRAVGEKLPTWAMGRVANSRHPQKQLVDAHWRGHMNECAIFIAALELIVGGRAAPSRRMHMVRELGAEAELDEIETRLSMISKAQLAARVDSYLAAHPRANDDYCAQGATNKWVSGLATGPARIPRAYMTSCPCLGRDTSKKA